jgi:hypothetical protein
MKVLGIVEWTQLDKRGLPIAGVRPLIEWFDWRSIDASEEFPSQGQVFWPNAQIATKDTLVVFRAEPNPGQKYEFKVVEPRPVYEVLDLRSCGVAEQVRVALGSGVRVPGPVGVRSVFIWCGQDVLVGPVEVKRSAAGIATLAGTNRHRITMYADAQVKEIIIDRCSRFVRVDDDGPSGAVDWDDDAIVLRRALDTAVRVEKQSGHDPGTTKKQIEEAARALAGQAGQDSQLDSYRMERAIKLLGKADVVARNASGLVAFVSEHPTIKASLDALRVQARADAEKSVRAELLQQLSQENTALKEATDAHLLAKQQRDACEKELSALRGELANLQTEVANAAKATQAAVDERVLAAIERPFDLLAEVSVLRPLLGSTTGTEVRHATRPLRTAIDWGGTRGHEVNDKAALRRALIGAARARGVDPTLMLQIHAAVVARLMPVCVGPAALAALTAYAHSACGGRVLLVHVSPSVIQPQDLLDAPGGGLLTAATAARDVDGLSLIILEGLNRAPIEGAVVPLLQLTEIGMSPLPAAEGLRIAASLVAGATTLPVTHQVWSHAAAIYPAHGTAACPATELSEVRLSSELLVPGDEPTAVIEALLDAWPDCSELAATMRRLGSALARLYPEEQVSDALLHGLVLPYVATSLQIEEQANALCKAGDPDGAIAQALRRLRRRLT